MCVFNPIAALVAKARATAARIMILVMACFLFTRARTGPSEPKQRNPMVQ